MRVPAYVPVVEPKIALVGEAPGEQEVKMGQPFVGKAGQELTRMLRDAGINRSALYITNVFHDRPPGNDLGAFCANKAEVTAEAATFGWPNYSYPQLSSNKYVRPYYCLELWRLAEELRQVKPNVVIAAGATALWALCGVGRIGKVRGTVMESTLVPGLKVLPTYHPAAILRDWGLRVISVADLMKAARESEFPELVFPQRTIYIRPTPQEYLAYKLDKLDKAEILSIDSETLDARFITCFSIAPSKDEAIVVPIIASGRLYYSAEDEKEIWAITKSIFENSIPKLLQNGLYDVQFFLNYGIQIKTFLHDSMILHHALQPRLPKGLDFLGSAYTNERPWKDLRPRAAKKAQKREE